ncbi:MAG: NFACT RNA binding domain-containing protein [Clostridiales bacterium]
MKGGNGMPLDGLFFNKLLTELALDLENAKINRIHQPDKNTVTMKLNQATRGNFTLVFSTHPQNARINITTATKENPKSPPLFAMVLRKHLEGGKIINLEQQGLDRVAIITIEGRNEIGEVEKKKLILEIMGKHSNLILTTEDFEIIGAVKQYNSNVSRYRQVLPHITYVAPPPQNKLNPFLITEDEFSHALLELDIALPIQKGVFQIIEGISPQTAEEIIFNCNLESSAIEEMGAYDLHKVFEEIKKTTEQPRCGTVILNNNIAKDFYFFPMNHYAMESYSFDTLSETLDMFYEKKEVDAAFASRKFAISKIVEQAKTKLAKKIQKQKKELATATDGDKYKLYGELISAYLYQVPDHGKEVVLPNFYDNEKELTIKLWQELTPSENAAKYFRRYNKAKTANNAIVEHLKINTEELAYLENLCYSIENTENDGELALVREEAVAAGYLKDKQKTKKLKKTPTLPPYEVEFNDYTIFIGRNNKQNDKLTLKIANKDDIWFHTKDIPGSHVIIRKQDNKTIPDEVIAKAAQYAAYHSKAKNSDKVPVDYTEVKQVKKPNGAKPGMVIYFEQTTLFVSPEKPIYKEMEI